MPTITIADGPLPEGFIPAALETLPCHRPLSVTRVPAGFPSPAQEYVEDMLDLNELLITNKTASFFFRSSSESMIKAGIAPGDLLLVDRSITPKHGCIVVAVVDGEHTVKYLYRRGGVIQLRPANPAYKPIPIEDGQELVIWGVVTSIIKQMKVDKCSPWLM